MRTKKELKEEYKKRKSQMGVFQIRNITNNRILIDSSLDMTSKWNRHTLELKMGTHQNKQLLKDWNEIGEENFIFEILTVLKETEQNQVNYRTELKLMQELVIEEIPSNNFY